MLSRRKFLVSLLALPVAMKLCMTTVAKREIEPAFFVDGMGYYHFSQFRGIVFQKCPHPLVFKRA